MRRKEILRRGLIGVVVLSAGLVAGRALYLESLRLRLYQAGQAAAAAGQWPKAWTYFRNLVALDPDYRDARDRLDGAALQAVQSLPGGDLEGEIELLRWLADSDERELLATALDRCVVPIAAGDFLMGSNTDHEDERPQRLVYLDAFEIDRYEVTVAQYQRFLEATGREPPRYWAGGSDPPGRPDYPVVGVNWTDADAYCRWAGKRLPSEAEWERACRGTDGRPYPWGETWDPRRANVDLSIDLARATPRPTAWEDGWAILQENRAANAGPGLQSVGSHVEGASPHGILDLAGNASEWVADWYNWNGYWDLSARNPTAQGPRWNHALRGSSWYEPYGVAGRAQDWSRCAARNSSHVDQDPRIGFRCARSVP